MTRSLTSLAAACATALVLAGAAAAPANAYYLGYGNGDATNEDIWAEQGVVEPAPSPSHMAPRHRATAYYAGPAHRTQRTAHHVTRKPGAHERNIAHHHVTKQPTKQS